MVDAQAVKRMVWDSPVGQLHLLPREVLLHPSFPDVAIDSVGAVLIHLSHHIYDLPNGVHDIIRARLHERELSEARVKRFLDLCRQVSADKRAGKWVDDLFQELYVYLW